MQAGKEMKKRSENDGERVLNLKTNTGKEIKMFSEHSFWLEISEKTYHVCEVMAFKPRKMPGFTWGAAGVNVISSQVR